MGQRNGDRAEKAKWDKRRDADRPEDEMKASGGMGVNGGIETPGKGKRSWLEDRMAQKGWRIEKEGAKVGLIEEEDGMRQRRQLADGGGIGKQRK